MPHSNRIGIESVPKISVRDDRNRRFAVVFLGAVFERNSFLAVSSVGNRLRSSGLRFPWLLHMANPFPYVYFGWDRDRGNETITTSMMDHNRIGIPDFFGRIMMKTLLASVSVLLISSLSLHSCLRLLFSAVSTMRLLLVDAGVLRRADASGRQNWIRNS